MYIEDINFSLWCDFVERNFLENEFEDLLKKDIVNGATSNPAIFKSAFLTSKAYQDDRNALQGKEPKEIYEALAIQDIALAADKMKSLYEREDDGFISIEVDPFLCDDARATIDEGKRLFQTIGKDNVMIKVPATEAGFVAMEELMKDGIHVNATLIFSPLQAKNCIDAFARATRHFGADKPSPQGVISVFVSRLDSKLDSKLESSGLPSAKAGIYNATKIYNLIENYELSNVRTLFASTGVKREDLAPEYYIKELLFANTVNTAPLDTIKAFIKAGPFAPKLPSREVDAFFAKIDSAGISIDAVYEELIEEGLEAFKKAFKQILEEL